MKPVLYSTSVSNADFLRALSLREGVFSSSYALVRNGKTFVVVPRMELSALTKNIKAFPYSSAEEKSAALKKLLKGVRSVAIDPSKLTLADKKLLRGVKLVDESERLQLERAVKKEWEVRAIQQAAAITRRAIAAALKKLRVGMTEKELAREIDSRFLREDARPLFETIAAFGANTAKPHHSPTARRLRKGDFVIVDCGAKINGYGADLTRTIVFGKSSKKQARILGVVKQAQQIALDGARPGVKAGVLARKVLAFIDGTEFAGRMTHSLGHSLGMEVHDGLRLSKNAGFALREGMVFTLEPGVYVDGFGGARLEDDIVVTRRGCRVL